MKKKISPKPTRPQTNRTGKLLILASIVVFIIVGLTAGAGRMLAQKGPHTTATTIVINSGQNARQIGQKLYQEGVINSPSLFYWAAKLTGLAPTLKAGEYNFTPHLSTRDILNRIALGKTQNRSITFPEGWTNQEILDHLTKNEAMTGTFPANVITITEGTLFPDTYSFTYGQDRAKLLTKLHNRHKDELAAAWEARSENTPLKTPEELLILASLIQRESAIEAEMPTVAGVYINRLNKGMLLQADPTVIYGLIKAGTWSGNLKRSHLRDENNPYNTYTHKGLPPTPISNPGRAALQAAANPEQHDYIFFVAAGDGSHNFAKTYRKHKQNVAKYLIEYRAQQQN